MAQQQQIVLRGYRELLKALQRADADTRKLVRQAFRDAGEIVRRDAAERLSKYSARSAQGLKVRVRQRGVAVEQSLRKTTGKRPDYGALQMRKALLPAREEQHDKVERFVEDALDRMGRNFDR